MLLTAWQGVRRRPLRNALTSLSLLIGVGMVVLVQASHITMEQAITSDALLTGGPAVTVTVPLEPSPDPQRRAAEWRELLRAGLSDRAGQATVQIVLPEATLRQGNRRVETALIGVGPDMIDLRPFPVLAGGWFDGESLAPAIVVNEATADRLSRDGERVVLWDARRQTETTARIAGIVYDGNSRPQAYLDLTQSGPWPDRAYRDGAVALLVHAPGLDESALRTRIEGLATTAERTAQMGEIRRSDSVGAYDATLDTTRRLFLGLAVLALVVGSLGILNVGLSALRERSDELSLRQSFGATRCQVGVMILLESQLVAVAAAVPAVALAWWAVPWAIEAASTQHAVAADGLPLPAILAGLAAGCAAALLGALAPAVRAARVPIASMMRS